MSWETIIVIELGVLIFALSQVQTSVEKGLDRVRSALEALHEEVEKIRMKVVDDEEDDWPPL